MDALGLHQPITARISESAQDKGKCTKPVPQHDQETGCSYSNTILSEKKEGEEIPAGH